MQCVDMLKKKKNQVIGKKSALQGIWKMEEVNFKYITVQLGTTKMSMGADGEQGRLYFFV